MRRFCKVNNEFIAKSPIIWDKAFKSRLNEFCGRQPLKNFKNMVCLKAVFHKIYLDHS